MREVNRLLHRTALLAKRKGLVGLTFTWQDLAAVYASHRRPTASALLRRVQRRPV